MPSRFEDQAAIPAEEAAANARPGSAGCAPRSSLSQFRKAVVPALLKFAPRFRQSARIIRALRGRALYFNWPVQT